MPRECRQAGPEECMTYCGSRICAYWEQLFGYQKSQEISKLHRRRGSSSKSYHLRQFLLGRTALDDHENNVATMSTPSSLSKIAIIQQFHSHDLCDPRPGCYRIQKLPPTYRYFFVNQSYQIISSQSTISSVIQRWFLASAERDSQISSTTQMNE